MREGRRRVAERYSGSCGRVKGMGWWRVSFLVFRFVVCLPSFLDVLS